jgi:hypothetical protein
MLGLWLKLSYEGAQAAGPASAGAGGLPRSSLPGWAEEEEKEGWAGSRRKKGKRGFWPTSRGNGFPFSDLDILGGNFNRNLEGF